MVQQRRKQKKWIYVIVSISVLLVAVAVFVGLKLAIGEKGSNNSGKERVAEQTTEKIEDGKNNTEMDDDEPKVKQYEGENPNKLDNLTGAITYAGVVGDKLSIRVNIDQYLGEGDCTLNLKRQGEVVRSMMAAINGAATTATCEGFDVELYDLVTGNYQIEVKLNSGDKIGVIMGEVTI